MIGGYWTRSNDVEIDLVGADRQPVAKELLFLGSVKWLENSTFDSHDRAALQKHRAAITDEPVPLVAVSAQRDRLFRAPGDIRTRRTTQRLAQDMTGA